FLEEKPNVQGLGHEWYFDLDYLTDTLGYKHVQANQYTGTQGVATNPPGIQDVDSDSDYDEQVIIVPSYPSHSIQRSEPKDTSGDEELARMKGQEQRVTSDAESLGLGFANETEELQTQASAKIVPPGCIPVPTGSISVPTGSIPVPASATMVSTNDVPVHTSSSTDTIFDDEPTTRFPCPSDLGNHDPSPGIFSFSSYDDEFGAALNNVASTMEVSLVATTRINTIHPQSLIIGDPTLAMKTRSKEEMQQFKFQNVWVLVDLPAGKYAIGTKWILKNKQDARGIVVRNKARLVAQGHRQEDGIDYDKVFAPFARIEAVRLFLAFASYMGFLVYQMDVKSVFLYGRIDEEVYVTQPKGFVDPQHPKKVYKVVKALYRLHQALRAWYATLSTFLLKHGYRRGTIDKTLFLKKNNRDIILVQVYVDYIIFGSTKKAWRDEFEALMKGEFQMSAMEELTFFLVFTFSTGPFKFLLLMVDRQDLVKLYGLVVTYYENLPVVGAGLILWGNLQVLFDSHTGGRGSCVWKHQNLWEIRSWRLYTLSNVHVLETVSDEVLYMFTDVSYPLSVKLMEQMLTLKLEIDTDVVGNDMTTGEQLIQFIKNQLAAAQASSV
nr:putative ribonuclease H-like domain-containing protein [Tanacetum cinerariifolium]